MVRWPPPPSMKPSGMSSGAFRDQPLDGLLDFSVL
jgi:hypothetical protein